jgi:hypothetical protein
VPVARAEELGQYQRALIMLRNIFWKVGVLGDYKRCSGSSRWPAAQGDIEGLIGSAMIAHHLISFARAASRASRTLELFDPAARGSVPAE